MWGILVYVKNEITNSKLQITNKYQIPNYKYQNKQCL